MFNLPKYFTVQCPIAYAGWQVCGNDRYMSRDEAEAVYSACSEHIACAMFGIDIASGEFEQFEIKRNF